MEPRSSYCRTWRRMGESVMWPLIWAGAKYTEGVCHKLKFQLRLWRMKIWLNPNSLKMKVPFKQTQPHQLGKQATYLPQFHKLTNLLRKLQMSQLNPFQIRDSLMLLSYNRRPTKQCQLSVIRPPQSPMDKVPPTPHPNRATSQYCQTNQAKLWMRPATIQVNLWRWSNQQKLWCRANKPAKILILQLRSQGSHQIKRSSIKMRPFKVKPQQHSPHKPTILQMFQ